MIDPRFRIFRRFRYILRPANQHLRNRSSARRPRRVSVRIRKRMSGLGKWSDYEMPIRGPRLLVKASGSTAGVDACCARTFGIASLEILSTHDVQNLVVEQ